MHAADIYALYLIICSNPPVLVYLPYAWLCTRLVSISKQVYMISYPIWKIINEQEEEQGAQETRRSFYWKEHKHRFTRNFPHLRSLPYDNRLRQLGLWSLGERRIRADLVELFNWWRDSHPLLGDIFQKDRRHFNQRTHLEISEEA